MECVTKNKSAIDDAIVMADDLIEETIMSPFSRGLPQ
jgi:hypothetical protein